MLQCNFLPVLRLHSLRSPKDNITARGSWRKKIHLKPLGLSHDCLRSVDAGNDLNKAKQFYSDYRVIMLAGNKVYMVNGLLHLSLSIKRSSVMLRSPAFFDVFKWKDSEV